MISSTYIAAFRKAMLRSRPRCLLRSFSATARQQRQADSSAASGTRTIGLRREDKSRWERRVALTPAAVERLIRETGAKVYVQPSTKRIFSDEAYVKAGACITEDLSSADVILGIKEVPEASLLPDKTYLFFSHTHKGNMKNMPMLKSILDKRIRLIDYELMTNENGQRLVAFGEYAGNAGMIDILHGMGHRFLGFGYSTPFMYNSMAHNYRTLADAKKAVRAVGEMIATDRTPKDFGPLVFAFTGAGNVTRGALDVFQQLPHEFVPAEDLPKLVNDKNPKLNKVYATQLQLQDYIQNQSGTPLASRQDYYDHPEKYHSVFHESIAPYVNTVVTGAYWDSKYPRMLTNDQLRDIQIQQLEGRIGKGKMMCLADIVCDIKGSFECLSHCTEVDNGFYYYDAVNNKEHQNDEGAGMQIMGIDILPAELPVESSNHFSEKLLPYVKELINPATADTGALSPLLANAIIADKGTLSGKHQSLKTLLPGTAGTTTSQTQSRKKTVLLLGSGMVSGPLVDHLTKRSDIHLVVASNVTKEAQALVSGRSNAEAVGLNISDREELSRLVSNADVVVSFVPAFLHTEVAKACVANRKHMVTASYVSPEMRELHNSAEQSDILIMNEVGLDPGIDHMSAMKIIDDAKRQNIKIRSFISWCGGLPAPEASNVPLGYKFSWSPRGVLTASGNDALYWINGKKHAIPGQSLLKDHFPVIKTPYEGFTFEGLANRNSLGYAETYGLGPLSEMDTMFRGTLRYQGYSDLLYAFKKLGFLESTIPLRHCTNWTQYFDHVLCGSQKHATNQQRFDTVVDKLGLPKDHPMVERVWDALTMLSGVEKTNVPFNSSDSALDALSVVLADRLKYLPTERDMVAMHHEFGLEHASGKKETLTSTLIHYGDEKYTAMAKTVGLPAAMTVELVLDNKIPERGVLVPTMPHVYLPILDQLEHRGVQFVEKVAPSHAIRLEPTGSGVWN
ncbi:Saccharopine dehydrogenase-domain-containing protein [Radiomyces spectabilis]|uniref:Saccharopine dehydrogenase-domain-containing protein n=1 Tax=Radiomyces spectabilis TaxID=64574 RepID=UPI00221F9716|nr:Saccharopine dehydrogenase-domain-containing protein [Radiomyces spectabilis]KAI8391256.1 Saccharopine dehydrogenase-domain-containing protein [Radiomyces spectabilis]